LDLPLPHTRVFEYARAFALVRTRTFPVFVLREIPPSLVSIVEFEFLVLAIFILMSLLIYTVFRYFFYAYLSTALLWLPTSEIKNARAREFFLSSLL